ncbi:ATP-dependent DNA helicase recG [Anaerobiospirillum thomasii]|uniref:ATP-dependent DNA helicase RecG n=1 Tax=Anaerobiospirillum thomasii TaxID=179995 RepID=UPI000D8CB1D0|nr:ATP-dependent DNA helicase RecG [Anaerobiospirillum thomasii]SPT72243.1 ATP-dependent DNA helicase recG [Anaerobiospirillum thomasii]
MAGSDIQYQTTPLTNLKGVGPKFALKFNNLNLYTIYDLIFNMPYRYEDRTVITQIADIKEERHSVQLLCTVEGINNMAASRAKILKVNVKDDSGRIDLIFFNTYMSFMQNFTRGKKLLILGQAKYDMYGKLNIMHPEIEFLQHNEDINLSKTLTPVYHLTDKLPQKIMRKCQSEALNLLKLQPFEELLPKPLNPFDLDINQALQLCHNPYPNDNHEPFILELEPFFKRLCYEELIAYQLMLLSFREKLDAKEAPQFNLNHKLNDSLLDSLPFKPTHAQIRVFDEIMQDISQSRPMHRLVHGDVGSGKTLVAIMVALQIAINGAQVALLAPTELLAMQHFFKFNEILQAFNIPIAILHSSQSARERSHALNLIRSGEARIIIGTHSLYQSDVIYNNLACVIIDEQHRFGIDQRLSLMNKAPEGLAAHLLIMTATPIPRTLQLALYSDLDVSTIDELPPNRTPVITTTLQDTRRSELVERVRLLLDKGVQVYWVCPAIDENENSDCVSVNEIYNYLQKQIPDYRVGLLHGKMNNLQKRTIMNEFINGNISILVATTIIEVGVDVPNASVMIIESSQRMGLAQLHQLRGRVGRGSKQSYCILVYSSEAMTEIGSSRLSVMKSTNNGFEIATEDLKLRGPGEVIGNAQSGFNTFKVADVSRDNELINGSRDAAMKIIKDETLSNKLKQRWFPQV